MPIIPATQRAEIRRIVVQSQPVKYFLTLNKKKKKKKPITKKGWWSG
jgi:hypothetical protein